MTSKSELEKKLEYAKGYRDALVDTWELVIKLATKGYSSRELQIMSRSQALESKTVIEAKITELEADVAQDDIIDADEVMLPEAVEIKPIIAVKLRPGMSYMVKESKPARCYKMIEREIAAGRPVICVSRLSPTEIREDYQIGKAQVIWLTTNEKMDTSLPPSALGMAADDASSLEGANDEYIQPSNLAFLFSYILSFLDGNHGGVVLMEGIEYLTVHNKFMSVLNFLQKVNENVRRTGSNMIISVNHTAFESQQYSQLETEIGQVL